MMDWFHSSQFRQQILGENSGSNLRKGYKICSMTTDSELDKSETPLLCETDKKTVTAALPEKTKPPSENVCTESSTSKKSSHVFSNFHQASTSEKESNKTKQEPRSLSMTYRQEGNGKSQESEKLLIDFGSSNDKEDDDDDDM